MLDAGFTGFINLRAVEMRGLWGALIFVFASLLGFSSGLSGEAKISLLTASPGQELYSAFGHSAVWVHDPVNHIDEVYNYGTFDFDSKNFYLNFVMGKLNYKLEVTNLHAFLLEYSMEGRGMAEQVLNITTDEMHRIYSFLLWNRKPENQFYLYDFFLDNCATRIRDFADKLLSIDWSAGSLTEPNHTFRQLIEPYLEPNPWARFGIDLVLGLPAHRPTTKWEKMFLPDHMYGSFESARHSDGRPLVVKSRILLPQTNPPRNTSLVMPVLICWAIFFLGLISLAKVRIARIFDKVFFTALGLVGIIILFLWFASDHTATKLNLNLMWAIPFHVYFIHKSYLLFPIGIPRHFFKVVFVLNLSLLVLWPIIPQNFHPGFFPLVLLSAIKSVPYAFGDAWKRVPVVKRFITPR